MLEFDKVISPFRIIAVDGPDNDKSILIFPIMESSSVIYVLRNDIEVYLADMV